MELKKRYISLFVENRIGVLAKVSGLLAGKSYNVDSLTVGPTEDSTVSRITISMTMDDITYEQVKKQLNRCVQVIKVMDFSDVPIHKKELLFIKVMNCSEKDKNEVFRIAQAFSLEIIDYDRNTVLIQCVKTEQANDDMIALFNKTFINRIEVVRGGSVAINAISTHTN